MEQAKTDGMKRKRTVLHFYTPRYSPIQAMRLHFNRGGYKPSPEEDSLAPFCRDPSQQIVAVELYGDSYKSVFVMKIDGLLKLARECGSVDLKWEQLRGHMVEVLPRDHHAELWVSGSRLFRIRQTRTDRVMRMDVYDFSVRASAPYMGTDRRGWTMRPCIEGRHLPRDAYMTHFSDAGHDSIVHLMVRTPLSEFNRGLTGVFYGRDSVVTMVRSRAQCNCGTFRSHRCVVSVQPLIECSVLFLESPCVLTCSVSQQKFIWAGIPCDVVPACYKHDPHCRHHK